MCLYVSGSQECTETKHLINGDRAHLFPLCEANFRINLSGLQSAFTCVIIPYAHGNQGRKGARRACALDASVILTIELEEIKVYKVIMACPWSPESR